MASTPFDIWIKGFMKEHLPGNDPFDLPTEGEIRALSDYVNGRSSVEQAALACTRDSVEPQRGGDIGFLIYSTAQELPETQARLVDLVKAISTLPTEIQGDTFWDHSKRINEFAFEIRCYWDGQLDVITHHHNIDPRVHQRFINLSAFIARLSGKNGLHIAFCASATLVEALEKDYRSQTQRLNTLVRAAAQYIEHAASAVYTYYNGDDLPAGELLKVNGGSGVDRWDFWKRRFEEISSQGDVEQVTAEAARQAAGRMGEVARAANSLG